MTEKEQKILDYIEKRKKFKLDYDSSTEDIETIFEKNGLTCETLTKDIEEFNTLVSDITCDDIKDHKLSCDFQRTRMKFLMLRRIYCEATGNTDIPMIKSFPI